MAELSISYDTLQKWTGLLDLDMGRKETEASATIQNGPTKEQRRAIDCARSRGGGFDLCANAAGVTRYILDAWMGRGLLVLKAKGKVEIACERPWRVMYGLARCTYSNVNVGGTVRMCGKAGYCKYRRRKR